MDRNQSLILIVDDTPENLRVLGELLEADGHGVRVADNGPQALEIAGQAEVDLVLLDIMMPGMDGYAVCRKLKSHKKTKAIPVIFLTAMDSDEDEAKGLKLGAVDYITKPFKIDLVRARVANHLALHLTRKELVRHNEHLEEVVADRSRELAEAHRRLLNVDSAKYDFLQLIYQELWAPGKGLVDLTRKILSVGSTATAELAPWILRFEDSQAALFETLNNALLLAGTHSAGEVPKMHPVPWEQVLRSVVDKLGPVAQNRGLALGLDLVEPGLVAGDLDLFFQALTTVIHASLLLSAPGSILSVTNTASDTHESLVVTIRCLEPEADLDTLFAPQTRFHSSSVGRQLGLAIPLAGKILRAQGGSVTLTPGEGETLILRVDLKKY